MKPLDPRLLRTASAARALLALGAVVGAAHVASIVAFCWSAASSIAAVIEGAPLDSMGMLVAATAASVVARALTQAALDALAARGAARVKSQLRERAIAAIDRGGSAQLGRRSSGSLATIIGPGLDAMDGYVGLYLPQLILTVVATPIVVGVLLLADPATGIAVMLTLPLIPVFMVLIGWATQAMQRSQWEALQSLSTGFLEVVRGLSTLTIFGRQHRQTARIAAVTDAYRARTMRVLRVSFLSSFALELAASLSVAVVAVSVGVRLIDGAIPFALGLFVLILTPEAYLPLRLVGARFHAAADGIAASDDVLDLIEGDGREGGADAPPAPTAPLASATPRDGETHDVALALEGVGVARGGRAVVSGLDAAWRRGTLVAITGPSGAGKSSLVAALLGLVPAEGRIVLAGREVPAEERLARIAWAGQSPELTAGSLEEVVALGSEHPDPALVARALALAGALDVPLTTVLGPAGQGLSGGQAQRAAIARAAYRALERDLDTIVLDEPTSALDAEAEGRVVAGLRSLADEGRLVVVVTHRPAVVAAADEVLDLAAIAAGSERWGRDARAPEVIAR
ncbi:ABC transporter ATP-binding protein [Yonghaparkia sp. Root332]|nr:thiol reductant ABC exporter subunit CydD [Yonghaparkia sp. Root332]KQV26907.1 ABC transporter ATP-binding protein [Yonghaparkia sp. Root332]